MKINEVTINAGDSLIFTIGNLEQNLMPSSEDLENWKTLLFKVEEGNYTGVFPPLWELTIIHNNRKPKEVSKLKTKSNKKEVNNMGEYISRPDDAPKDSKGASADTGKYLQAVALAAQLGKTVEEVLAFLGTSGSPVGTQTNVSVVNVLPKELASIKLPLSVEETVEISADAKIAVPQEVPQDDKFIVTEIVNLEDASESDLDKIAQEEDDENDWTGKIRVGSKVKIVFQVSASRINWVGKRGKVVRIVGNEAAKVYDVEFAGGKVPKVRLNKKTNKLERGYEKKVIRNTFSEDQVELAD